jgi:hypothetical protein
LRELVADALDGEDVARPVGVVLDLLAQRAIPPARVIAIGKDGPLRKPLRQSYVFDAIVKAVGPQSVDAPP